jgi:elongation factor Ts
MNKLVLVCPDVPAKLEARDPGRAPACRQAGPEWMIRMSNDIEQIKKIREKTGAGMSDIKSALEEAKGNSEKALEILRLKGQAKAAKKADRQTTAGLVEGYVHMGRVGALVELKCETDFVARTEDFKQFAHDVAMQVAAATPQYVKPEDIPAKVVKKERQLYEAELKTNPAVAGKSAEVAKKIVEGKLQNYYEQVCLLNQSSIKEPDKTVLALLTELISKLGENIVISRFERMELGVSDAQ